MNLTNRFLKDYRKMYRLVKDGTTFVAFDTETTGLSAQNCRIIEIGAVKFNNSGILGSFNSLINPECHIPEECTQINHITDSMVESKPIIKELLPSFIDFIKDTVLIGHNVQFDIRFLDAELERCFMPIAENTIIDTLQFSRWAFPEQQKYRQPLIASLLGIEVKDAHRAYDDAFVCANIFLNLIKATSQRQKV